MANKIALQTLAAVFLNNLQHQSPQPFIVYSYDAKSGQLIGQLEKCTSYQQFWRLYKNNDLSEKEKIDTYWRIYLETNCGQNCLLFFDFLKQVVESGAVIMHENREISLDQIYISKCMMTIEDIEPRIKCKIMHQNKCIFSYEMFHTYERNLSLDTNSENHRRTMLVKKEMDKMNETMHTKAVTHFFISIAPVKQHSDMITHLDFSGITYCGESPWFTNKVRYYQVSNGKVPISIYETKHLQIKYFQNDNVNLILTTTKADDHIYYQILCKQFRAFEYALKLKDRPYFPIVLSRPNDFKKVRTEELGEKTKTLAHDFTHKCLEECDTTALPKGSRVLLCGLRKKESLNGTTGKIITTLNVSKQRYGVQIHDAKISVSINNVALIFPSWYLNEFDSIKY